MEDRTKIEEIARELMNTQGEEVEPQKKSRAAKPRQAKPNELISINGSGNQVINGHGSITNTYHVEKPPKPTVVVQTGVGVIDAQQKRRLLDLRDDFVEASMARNAPKTPGAVMKALNGYMKVNKYDEILAGDFDKAVKWLVRQRAILNSMRSAPKKLPDWRNGRIRAVHSRCKEKSFEAWRLDYMKKKFGKDSMIDLSDADLETLYRAVMAKK
jgi:hypothetical protein